MTMASTNLSLWRNVLPRRFNTSLRYAQTLGLLTGAVGVVGATQLWRLNSLFDPDQTGVGHQPYGFDQLANFYAKYIVHGFDFKLTGTTLGGTPEVQVLFQIGGGSGFATISGVSNDTAVEKSTVSSFVVGPNGLQRTACKTMKGTCWQVLGVTKQQYLDDLSNHAALVGGNPTVNLAVEVGIASFSQIASEQLQVQLVINYHCEFFDPVTMAAS